ncbi:hypothetical protein BDF19DRAFT_429499 [Syncephalis fuscata]|nr:hypothetical protein BDF19DRAFT_429499 [Syncephalis fuscata]
MDSSSCSHEIIFAGMCAYCGVSVVEQSDPHDESTFVSISHDTSALRATRKHAEKLHQEETERLLSERRLSLIVDLDQTIVHAWDDPVIESWLVDENHPYHYAAKDIHRIILNDSPRALYLKLRPGTMDFLEKTAEIFELHIYTAGSRSYANAVAQILDPKGKLFGRRILSRDESGSQRTKDLKRLFPCDDAMVLIIDDRADVWRRVPNLIQVRKYEFYLGVGDINAPTGRRPVQEKNTSNKSTKDATSDEIREETEDAIDDKPPSNEEIGNGEKEKENGEDTNNENKSTANVSPLPETPGPIMGMVCPVAEDNDNELTIIWDRLFKIHTAFYMLQDENQDEENPLLVKADVKDVANGFRHRTLLGCHVLFSGLIAVNEAFETNEFWLMAKECGATCVRQLSPWVTHLVAAKPGTSKVHEAEDRDNVFIVSKEWLEESFYTWRRASERTYALPGTDQPSIDAEERIAQVAAMMVRSRAQNEEENAVHKRTYSAIEDNDLRQEVLAEDSDQKRSRLNETSLDEDEQAELMRLSPSSDADEMQEKLRHCDWSSMMDDVMAELEEDGEHLDTETEADAWADDAPSSDNDESEVSTPNKLDTLSATAHQRLEARLLSSKQRRSRPSETTTTTTTSSGYRPSPLRHQTEQPRGSNGEESDLESEPDRDPDMERRRQQHRHTSSLTKPPYSADTSEATTPETNDDHHQQQDELDELDDFSELDELEQELQKAMESDDEASSSSSSSDNNNNNNDDKDANAGDKNEE